MPRFVKLVVAHDDQQNPITLPAIVVRSVSSAGGDTLNLQVFLDGPASAQHGFSLDDCAQGLAYRELAQPGTGIGCWLPDDSQPCPAPGGEHGNSDYTDAQVEELVRAVITGYDEAPAEADDDAARAAALQAALDKAQEIDLRDGVDDRTEAAAEFTQAVDLVIDTYLNHPSGDDEESIQAAVAAVLAALHGGQGTGPGEPDQGQLAEGGAYITAQAWFLDRGFGLPAGPDVGANFIWAPNAPSPGHEDWATAPWVWRPPLA